MSQREITYSDLERISKGVQMDTHYQEDCDPKVITGKYIRDNKTIGHVKCHFRYCNCGRYNQATCSDVLKNFRKTWVPVPTDGIFIHRFDCEYELMKVKSHVKIGNQQRDVYTYEYKCTCRYTLNPNTSFHDPNNRGELLVCPTR